ncbi:D-alanine--D-alanine ligase [Patescibacteria group bacterium]|nr:D-alanine--D-alanine ligase [Patescibacteria group bacterium]
MKKLKVAVIFGGQSSEHEVSLVSASGVIGAMDPEKYQIVEIGIKHDGEWLTGEGCLEKFKSANYGGLQTVAFDSRPGSADFDIAFPVLHGPFGEDGTVQGLLEMFGIPYVGCGVLASSTAMDKLQCKAILKAADVPVVPYVGFTRKAWKFESEKIMEDIEENIGLPCFVKPANMGSSVGITKVKKVEDLKGAVDLAAEFDSRIMVEVGLNAREIECAVIGNDNVEAAPLGEIVVGGEFYDYEDKYVNGVSHTQVPADLDEDVSNQIKNLCIRAYKLLDCSGLARVDIFVDRESGKVYLNELNTMPGFTSISMYPKMMRAHGLKYSELIDRLIELGLGRSEEKKKNQIRFDGGEWFK